MPITPDVPNVTPEVNPSTGSTSGGLDGFLDVDGPTAETVDVDGVSVTLTEGDDLYTPASEREAADGGDGDDTDDDGSSGRPGDGATAMAVDNVADAHNRINGEADKGKIGGAERASTSSDDGHPADGFTFEQIRGQFARIREALSNGTMEDVHRTMREIIGEYDDRDAARVGERLDEIASSDEFARYEEGGDMPSGVRARLLEWLNQGTRDPQSFDGSGYSPMSPVTRKIGEFGIGLGLFFGNPTTGTNDPLTDVAQASGAEWVYQAFGEPAPDLDVREHTVPDPNEQREFTASPGEELAPEPDWSGELSDPGVYDAAPDPQRIEPRRKPNGQDFDGDDDTARP